MVACVTPHPWGVATLRLPARRGGSAAPLQRAKFPIALGVYSTADATGARRFGRILY